jgi:hypothetical protein
MPKLELQRPPWGHGGSEAHPVLKEDHIGVVEGHSGVVELILDVRYHSGGSMELNACILLLAHMVYL